MTISLPRLRMIPVTVAMMGLPILGARHACCQSAIAPPLRLHGATLFLAKQSHRPPGWCGQETNRARALPPPSFESKPNRLEVFQRSLIRQSTDRGRP